jgi:hypothetical protein
VSIEFELGPVSLTTDNKFTFSVPDNSKAFVHMFLLHYLIVEH